MTGEKKPIYYFDPLVKINIDSEVVDIFREKRISVIDEKELRRLYIDENKTLKEIAKITGWSLRTTNRVCEKYEIRKYEIRKKTKIGEKELRRLYIEFVFVNILQIELKLK